MLNLPWRRTAVRTAVLAEDAVQTVAATALTRTGRHVPVVVPFIASGTPTSARVRGRVLLGRRGAPAPEPVVEDGTTSPAPVAPPGRSTRRSRRAVLHESLRRFVTVEVPRVPVTIRTPGGETTVRCDRDGYIDAQVTLPGLEPGWHDIELSLASGHTASGRLLVVDPAAQVAIVSDIDDTILETGLTRGLTFLRVTLLSEVAERAPLPGAAALYRALTTDAGGRGRPVFYLSTSPWNLHEMLVEFLVLRGFPLGPLMLTDWGPGDGGLFRVSSEEHKLTWIRRILADHPHLGLVLVGDSGQADPQIYATAAREQPDRVRAVYIRRTTGSRRDTGLDALATETSALGVPMLVVDDSVQIARHAATLGLLDDAAVEAVAADMAGGD